MAVRPGSSNSNNRKPKPKPKPKPSSRTTGRGRQSARTTAPGRGNSSRPGSRPPDRRPGSSDISSRAASATMTMPTPAPRSSSSNRGGPEITVSRGAQAASPYMSPPSMASPQLTSTTPFNQTYRGGPVGAAITPPRPETVPTSNLPVSPMRADRMRWNAMTDFYTDTGGYSGGRGSVGEPVRPGRPLAGIEDLPPNGPARREPMQADAGRPRYLPTILKDTPPKLPILPVILKTDGASATTLPGLPPGVSPQGAQAAADRYTGLGGAAAAGVDTLPLPPSGPPRKAANIPWTVLGFGDHGQGETWARGFAEQHGYWPWEGPGSEEENLGRNLAAFYNGDEAGGPTMLNVTPGEPYYPEGYAPEEGLGYGGGGGFYPFFGGGGGGDYSPPANPWLYADLQRGL